MKVSLFDAQKQSNVALNECGTEMLLTKIGAQLGAVEEVIYTGKKYDGSVVVRVVSTEQHPNADRLHVVMIDDGGITPDVKRYEQGHVQVVCGAPNVREGIVVVWLPPGSTVPISYDKDPFVLEARELRGVVSNGMLASAHELGITDDHSGILELQDAGVPEDQLRPGRPFKELLGLDDVIVDCENKMFTHRPDCFGTLGVARELAGIQQLAFKSPDWYMRPLSLSGSDQNDSDIHEYGVSVEEPELVSRYMLLGMDNIKVGQSPLWLQVYLSKVGIRPINNIVDITNYIMMLTGQPIHAFDFDKIAKNGNAQVVVRKPRSGETLTLLDGKTITPRADAILICDSEKPIALGGIMGGGNSEIDENTTRILIECATFDMYNVRKTSMEHGVFTDAAMRFTKGQSPLQCPAVLAKAADFIKEIVPGSRIVGEAVDSNHAQKEKNDEIEVSPAFINARLGSTLSAADIAALLTNVEFTCEVDELKDTVRVAAPFWRMDIELAEDIVEEVGRLHGFDQLPLELPGRNAAPTERNSGLDLKQEVRAVLSAAGANEVLTYSFVHGNLMQKTGSDPEKWAYHLRNALSPDLQYYRTALMPSLLDKVRGNIRADLVREDDNEFALFEIGKVHVKGHVNEEKVPEEMERVALVIAADAKTAARKYDGSPYYLAKLYLSQLLEDATFEPLENDQYPVTSPYQLGRSAVIKSGGDVCGVIGEFKASVKKALKLPDFCAGFEIDLKALRSTAQNTYRQMSVFPKVEQDITFTLPHEYSYQELVAVVREVLVGVQHETQTTFTLCPRDMYQSEEMTDVRRITLRIWLAHPAKTLKIEETNHILEEVTAAAQEKLQAVRV